MPMKSPLFELSPAEERYLSERDLRSRWHTSSNSIRRMVGRGQLEPPVKFGPRAVRFRLSAILRAEQDMKPSRRTTAE